MTSTIMAQGTELHTIQPGLAIPAKNTVPDSDDAKKPPQTIVDAPAVEEPPSKASKDNGDDKATTDLSTGSVLENPQSEKSELSKLVAATVALESHRNPTATGTWPTYLSISNTALLLDIMHDVSSRDTQFQGLKVAGALLEYLHSLEERLNTLGEGIQEKHSKKTDSTGDKANDGPKLLSPTLSYSFFHAENEFDVNGQLVEKNDRPLAHSNSKEPNSLIRAVYSWADEVAANPPKLSSEESPRPEQIKLVAMAIYSTPIAKFFEEELGFDTLNHDIVRIGTPFRPLLRNLQAIRNHTEALQKRFSPNESSPGDEQTESAAEQPAEASENLPFAANSSEDEPMPSEPYNQIEALGQFQLLLEFVDRYLSKQVNLYQRLNTGHGDKVAFQDLWMLFDTGSTIYCPIREGGVEIQNSMDYDKPHRTQRRHLPQAFRVTATIGGVPLTKSLAPKYRDGSQGRFDYADTSNVLDFMPSNDWAMLLAKPNSGRSGSSKNKNRYNPLYVMCFYVDFDGAKYGTVTETFVFKPYDGEIDIKSLEAYPLQYCEMGASSNPEGDQPEAKPKGALSVEALVERGRKFIDATAVTHMSYDGLTVGTVREEVNSEIMIDFRTAYEEYHDSFQASKSVVPQYSNLQDFWPASHEGDFFEYYDSCADNVWCTSTCISELHTAYQKRKQSQMETKIKTILEESEYEKVHQKEDYLRLREYMEKNDLIQLLPGVVPGYALRSRRWVQLDLSQLRLVKLVDGWDRLVLPKGHGEMVQAMVETHAKVPRTSHNNRDDKVEMDLVRGKGKGCIILLHGAPGVGKTSTAECVASYTGRPLYPITCGDIGYLPDSVEKNMEEHFKLARRWGCVLLLDEADVFLAKRTKSDVKRNGLVSVFLRILEYYTGILFLTTNRVGAIDDAFRSRLHLTLYYPKLNRKQTRKIWKTNLKNVDANNEQRQRNDQPLIHYDSKRLLKWVDQNWDAMQWNGRQIRNGFQTAIALAEFKAAQSGSAPKKATLSTELFERIAQASMEFSDYLLETHGGDEDHLASRDQVRPKSFEPKARIKPLEDSEDSSSDSSSAAASDASSNESDARSEDSSDESDSESASESDSDDSDKNTKDKSKKKGKTSEPVEGKKTRKEKETKDSKQKDKKKSKKDRRDR